MCNLLAALLAVALPFADGADYLLEFSVLCESFTWKTVGSMAEGAVGSLIITPR